MELISYEQFGRLRMKQFAPADADLSEDDNLEWMGGLWTSENIGFTHVSRHEDTPDEAGGLEVDFSEFPEMSSLAILDAIHLPLRPGMSFQQIVSVLGEPEDTEAFVADRKSYNFTVGSRSPYYISATVHETDGLVFVSVIRKDVLSKIRDA